MIQPSDRIIDRRRGWEARVEMEILSKPQDELSTYDKLVYVALCGHADRSGGAFPTVAKLAGIASCSARQVFRALSVLEQRGLIVRSAQVTPGEGQTGNLYEVHGVEDYIPPTAGDRCDCQAQGADVTVSHTPPDCQSDPYIRSNEQLQNNSKDKDSSPSESRDTSPADNRNDRNGEPEALILPEEVPHSMRETVDYFLLATGRRGIMPSELSVLREFDAAYFPPSRVQKEFKTALKRERFCRSPGDLTFDYLWESLQHQVKKWAEKKKPPSGTRQGPGEEAYL